MGIIPLLFLLQIPAPAPISADSATALRDLAHRAERTYEYLLRSLAPKRYGELSSAQRCDEIVGRFCLRYEGGGERRPDTTVAGKVISARQLAVEMLRHAFSALPGELTTAGPLLRYLIEDGRAEEAVAAARTFAWASGDSAWGALMLGYALHATAEDSLAQIHFAKGLEYMSEKDRRHIEDVLFLLDHDERSVYKKLSAPEKIAYEEALWRLADPLYLTPGNERYAEHLARHVWSRLLAEAPRVARMHHWGADLEQLTIRYGVPTSRERLLGDMIFAQKESMVEYFDPEQLAYLPERLYSDGVPPTPPPGATWILDGIRARSGYHPATIRRLRPLDHQVSRFPAGDSTILRIDASLALDDKAAGATAAEFGFFILDREYRHIFQDRGAARIVRDTINATFETTLEPGLFVYSAEFLEDSSRFAGRARYSVEITESSTDRLALSDPVIANHFGDDRLPTDRNDRQLHPLTSLILTQADTIGLFAEVHGLRPTGDLVTHFQVELKVGNAESPPLLARAFGWLGRKIGISKPAETPGLAWEGESVYGRPAIIAVDLPLERLRPGLYAIELMVTDRVTAETRSTSKLIRIR